MKTPPDTKKLAVLRDDADYCARRLQEIAGLLGTGTPLDVVTAQEKLRILRRGRGGVLTALQDGIDALVDAPAPAESSA